jgi:DNA-binding transcriptional ArsR family regulator
VSSPDRRAPSLAERRLEDLESVFGALAHEQRRHVLLTLEFRGGEMTAGDIADRFACSWPTTTRHLRVLQDAGLVTVEKRGRERVYKLQKARLQSVVGDWLAWFKPAQGAEE